MRRVPWWGCFPSSGCGAAGLLRRGGRWAAMVRGKRVRRTGARWAREVGRMPHVP